MEEMLGIMMIKMECWNIKYLGFKRGRTRGERKRFWDDLNWCIGRSEKCCR